MTNLNVFIMDVIFLLLFILGSVVGYFVNKFFHLRNYGQYNQDDKVFYIIVSALFSWAVVFSVLLVNVFVGVNLDEAHWK